MASTKLSIRVQTALEQSDIHCSPDGISGYARKTGPSLLRLQIVFSPLFSHRIFFARLIRFDSKRFALCNSARRLALSPRPARLIKYVSILIPDPGPFGETFRDASVRAIVVALLLNNPLGGCVESVVTLDTHRLVFFLVAIRSPFRSACTHDQAQQTGFLWDLCVLGGKGSSRGSNCLGAGVYARRSLRLSCTPLNPQATNPGRIRARCDRI